MANTLIKLPQFSYTQLDFDTYVDDVKRLIREHPEYNQKWDDFLESNAGRMFVEMMSFLLDKAADRVDWIAQEMFVSTATQRQSLINILKLINHRPLLPAAAKINVRAKLTKWVEGFYLPQRESLTAADTNGNLIRFECLKIAQDGKPDYEYQHFIDTGTEGNQIKEIFNIPFYAGQTQVEQDIYMEGIDNEELTLRFSPVIENSIRVYSEATGAEWPQVESFISKEAQQNQFTPTGELISVPESEKLPPYMIEIDAQNRVTLKWGAASLVKIPHKDERIRVIYRTGGGLNTNIVSNSLQQTKTYQIDSNKQVTVIYTNPNGGFGGRDEEDLEEAKVTAPLSLRSANKTVTHEDYINHLETSALILKANVVGKENEPQEIVEEYGYHLPPLETWIFAVPQKEDYSSFDKDEYTKRFKIGRSYTEYITYDYEDIELTGLIQSVFLKKLNKYKGFDIYVTLYEFIDDGTGSDSGEYLIAESFVEGEDYTIDRISSMFSRITTADGGSIPSGEHTLRVRYVSQNIQEFYNKTVHQFLTDEIQLDAITNSLYPNQEVLVSNKKGEPYSEDVDYTIDYETNTIHRLSSGNIQLNQYVIIEYFGNWDNEESSEADTILDIISDKKMICVDNVVKDSIYTTFSVSATVYCYKNLRNHVQNNLKPYLQSLYNIENAKYDNDVYKAEFISKIMNFDGVRFVEVNYFGKNYNAYRKMLLNEITNDDMIEANGISYEHKIPAKYNEILILSDDKYEGNISVENQRQGLIFTFKDSVD